MAYSKLFSSIVHSSLWTEEDHVRLLFVTLLAIADREGFVYGSRMGLERLANIISEDHDRDPWQALMDPDKDSSDLMRNPENEGRRIEQVPGGFRILNFLYYRGLRNEDDRRRTNREAKQRQRARIKLAEQSAKVNQGQPASAKVSQSLPISDADADADADTDAEQKKNKTTSSSSSAPSSSSSDKKPKPNLKEVIDFFGMQAAAMEFWDYYESNGWRVGRNPMKDWQAAARRWKREPNRNSQRSMSAFEIEKRIAAITEEISKTWKRNGGKRVPQDGIDEMKKRRDELHHQLVA